ncbi:ketopantoate reductase family protein [Halomonas sp. HMF6819]|uniref:ketopantoate reductase family protein n=1 Tax=Halomonas sp. HMF6819 TaxID=3373085 RepID=UPI00378B13B4
MNSIVSPRIAIVGAGAIGITLAARLAKAGHRVSVLARGEALAAIEHRGVELNDMQGHHSARVTVSDQSADLGIQDIVLLCTKAHAVPELLPALSPLFGVHTWLVPLLNGTPWWLFMGSSETVDHVEAVDPGGHLIGQRPAECILGCVVYITARLEAPGRAVSTTPHRLVLGEIASLSPERQRRLGEVVEVLTSSGVETRHTPRIRDAVWSKIAANLSSNPLSVITRTTLDTLYSHPWLQKVVEALYEETRLTAQAHGSQLEITLQELLEIGTAMRGVKTSMLQDYQRERPLELTAIVEGVIELADRKGIAVPVTRTIVYLTHYLESAAHRQREQTS